MKIVRKQFDLINKVPDALVFQFKNSEEYCSVPSFSLSKVGKTLKECEDNTVKAFVDDNPKAEVAYLFVGYHKGANRAFIGVLDKDAQLLGQEI